MPDSQIKVDLIDTMGTDLSVVNAARVSFDKESDWVYCCGEFCGDRCEEGGAVECPTLSDKDTKLIHYLAEHGHYSPFGHCFASVRVHAPVFVARQLVKHKFLRWNEVSRRYVDAKPEFYTPDVWRGKAEDKKQGSAGVVEMICLDNETGEQIRPLPYKITGSGRIEEHCQDVSRIIFGLYNEMIESGVCPEQARMILPQSMMTTWWWSGSMDAFANMCNLRLKEDTQYETRLVAQQIDKYLSNVWPVSWRALVNE